MSAAQVMWESVQDEFDRICAHPFVRGLIDGSLPDEVFERYLIDDAHYLDRYARVLATLAARAPDSSGVELFAASTVGAIAAERELHREFLAPRGLDPDRDTIPPPTQACRIYTDFLTDCARSQPFDVALAAVLPCFRVYAEVGHHVLTRRAAGPHPYAEWVNTYTAPEFAESVRRVEAYLDQVANDHAAMQAAYLRATTYEWEFWDAAWQPATSGDHLERLLGGG